MGQGPGKFFSSPSDPSTCISGGLSIAFRGMAAYWVDSGLWQEVSGVDCREFPTSIALHVIVHLLAKIVLK